MRWQTKWPHTFGIGFGWPGKEEKRKAPSCSRSTQLRQMRLLKVSGLMQRRLMNELRKPIESPSKSDSPVSASKKNWFQEF